MSCGKSRVCPQKQPYMWMDLAVKPKYAVNLPKLTVNHLKFGVNAKICFN